MKVDAPEVDEPEKRVDRVGDDVANEFASSGLRRLRRDGDLLRQLRRGVLDPFERAPRAVVVPLERQGSVAEMGEDHPGDRLVVLDRVLLPERDVRPPELVGMVDGRHDAFMSVRAAEDCTAIRISAANLYQVYSQDLKQFTLIQMNMGREVCRRLREANNGLFGAMMGMPEANIEHVFLA